MAVNKDKYLQIKGELNQQNVTLVAVSKTKPVEDILELYSLGQRDFGENYVQELADKYRQLPNDIRWHFIGHLQTNKVKYIAPFVHLVHGIDSFKLLKETSKQGEKNNRIVNVLLQIHIAQEETKFGLNEPELKELITSLADEPLKHICIKGLMGMASFTEDQKKIETEFSNLQRLFNEYAKLQTSNFRLQTLSMGMSSDFDIAIANGSNMVRIGSLIFGERPS